VHSDGASPSRCAAVCSASSDGFPTTVTSQPVMPVTTALIARDVPSDRPSAVARTVEERAHAAGLGLPA
jgi:hypothetical protein